jgi:DNA-binding transcriptional ArsR family regulator
MAVAATRGTLNQMVRQTSLDRLFHALAHDVRRDMVDRLAAEDLTIGALAEPLAMSFVGASKHVKVLEQVGLIERTVEGRRHWCRLHAATLEPASAWLQHYERYWTDRLDALEDLIARSSDR